jgi:hypothetical protein
MAELGSAIHDLRDLDQHPSPERGRPFIPADFDADLSYPSWPGAVPAIRAPMFPQRVTGTAPRSPGDDEERTSSNARSSASCS